MIVIAPSSSQHAESASGWVSTALAPPITSRDRKVYDGSTAPGDYRATLPTTNRLNFETPPVSRDKVQVINDYRSRPGQQLYVVDPTIRKAYAGMVADTIYKNQNPYGKNNFGR